MLRLTFSLSLNPPVPVSALVTPPFPARFLEVTFDQPLAPGVPDLSNWTFRFAGTRYSCILPASISDNKVTLQGSNQGPDPGPDVCTYSPPPFDIENLEGAPAVAFTNFPIT